MFEDAREFAALHAGNRTMLASFEVCVNHDGPYVYKGKQLDSKYASACTCKRAGYTPYETACFKDAPSASDPMLSSASSPLLSTSTPPRVEE